MRVNLVGEGEFDGDEFVGWLGWDGGVKMGEWS